MQATTKIGSLLTIGFVLLSAASPAYADFSKKVTGTFKGQIVLSKDALATGDAKQDKATIDGIKKAKLLELDGTDNEKVMTWQFHYTAFLAKAPQANLKLKFFDKAGNYVADQSLTGVDLKSTVLSGDITISEDEGLTRSKPYTLKLVTDKELVLASTPVTMK
jgi:hypothetical protein